MTTGISIIEEGQVFYDSRSVENFFYMINSELILPALRDPVKDELSSAIIEKQNTVEVSGKFYDKVLLEKFMRLGDYRKPTGALFTPEELTNVLKQLDLEPDPRISSQHIALSLLDFFSVELASTVNHMIHEAETIDSFSQFSGNFDELWNHLKLCVSGLASYNMLKAYRLCNDAFIKISALHLSSRKDTIDLIYESIGNMCAAVTSSILRSTGKEEMCKMITRTRKTSNLKFV
jgi:hypothetical protein